MPAYYQNTIKGFLDDDPKAVFNALTTNYAKDGYYQLLGTQSKSWTDSIPIIRETLSNLLQRNGDESDWGVFLEYPLYRLRKRIDFVLVSKHCIYVVELKVGASEVNGTDIRQVEEYALDLRDFHKESHRHVIYPILCCTALPETCFQKTGERIDKIQPVTIVSAVSMVNAFTETKEWVGSELLDWREWGRSSYEPVPTIIEAATSIFAGHNVKDISRSDAENLRTCSEEVIRLINETKNNGKKCVIIVTGVPGAGKTLAGLKVAHHTNNRRKTDGEIIYLSGNTPLVLVLREALALDEQYRSKKEGIKRTLKDIRHEIKARIQHIMDFLKEYYLHDMDSPSFEHAIVFDEAQRAWNHDQGKKKFSRNASEPELLMEIMDRHNDWAAIVCLVGAGQEINAGEPGMQQWGEALKKYPAWELITPSNAIDGSHGTAGTALFPEGVPKKTTIRKNDNLMLTVPMRSFRSEQISNWVDAVLENRSEDARRISKTLGEYPITLVRSIDECRKILWANTRGTRRCGLLASTKAVRLVAEGLGVSLSVQDKHKIAHWYLKPQDDFRSSNSLEVMANEYTSQGLELDYAGICWGGDFVRESNGEDWCYRRLQSTTWQNVQNKDLRRFIRNKYRVFLTRAREGMVLFVPYGDSGDSSRVPGTYQAIAEYLKTCGVRVNQQEQTET
jgi:hypothetical protein